MFRKDSRKLPIGDPDVDWEETVYLNLIIHQFNYTLTLAICTRTSPKELQVLRRHSQRVYASPSRRKMDTKGDGEEMTYPHICFMVDNFDEVFSDILVRDGEMVCVELVANDRDGSVQGVIFLGSIRYDALKKVYDSRVRRKNLFFVEIFRSILFSSLPFTAIKPQFQSCTKNDIRIFQFTRTANPMRIRSHEGTTGQRSCGNGGDKTKRFRSGDTNE